MEKKIEFQGSNEVAKGSFANISIINHDSDSFMIDFAYLPPGMLKGNLQSRIIMTAADFKTLFLTLSDNIQKYEKKFGTITPKKPGILPNQ